MSSRLKQADFNFLYNAYYTARNSPQGSALAGAHWYLMAALAKMGYPVSTVDQAYAMAERLLWPSY